MKTRTLVLIYALLALVIIQAFFIYTQANQIRDLKQRLPHLLPGEKITRLDLLGLDQEHFDVSMLTPGKVYLFMVPKMPCSTCNQSVSLWIQMSKILGEGVTKLCVIPGGWDEAARLQEALGERLNFPVYVPEDAGRFRESLRLHANTAQTILYCGGVKYVKTGDLDGESFTAIVKMAKELQRL